MSVTAKKSPFFITTRSIGGIEPVTHPDGIREAKNQIRKVPRFSRQLYGRQLNSPLLCPNSSATGFTTLYVQCTITPFQLSGLRS